MPGQTCSVYGSGQYGPCPPGERCSPASGGVGVCEPSGGGGGTTQPSQQPCPGGQERINGQCRYPGDYPCPSGQCKDVVTGVCRNPGGREKVSQTDIAERETGGGRGYCRQLDPGRAGRGGGTGGTGGGAGGFGGGGGAGAGAGGFGGFNPLFSQYFGVTSGVRGALEGNIMDVLTNQTTRFTPEVMQDIIAGSRSDAERQIQSETAALNADLARRGMARSGIAVEEAGDIRRAGEAGVSDTLRQVRIQKATTDFMDRLAGLNAANNYISQAFQHVASLAATDADRERTYANLQLGREQIKAEMEMLMKRLAGDRELQAMILNSQEFLAMFQIGQGGL